MTCFSRILLSIAILLLVNSIGGTKNAMSVEELDSIETVLKYVAVGRADIAVGVPTVIDQILQKEEFTGYDFIRAEPPLTALPIFAYLHKKQKDIVPLIAQSMCEMKLDRTYKKIIQRQVRRHFNSLNGRRLPVRIYTKSIFAQG